MSLIHLEIPVFVVIHTAANTFSQSTIHSVMKTSKKVQKFGRGKSKIVIGLSLFSHHLQNNFTEKKVDFLHNNCVQSFFPRFPALHSHFSSTFSKFFL